MADPTAQEQRERKLRAEDIKAWEALKPHIGLSHPLPAFIEGRESGRADLTTRVRAAGLAVLEQYGEPLPNVAHNAGIIVLAADDEAGGWVAPAHVYARALLAMLAELEKGGGDGK